MWKYLERGSVQGIALVISIVLARILAPDDFGVIIIITVFINISNVLIQSGFNLSLIQRNDITKDDYSSVFFINLIVTLIIYLLLFFTAPIIAKFYQNMQLVIIIRVMSIILFLGALNSVQLAVLINRMNFKSIFANNLISVVISGIVGISMARMGYGVWALVVQQLVNKGLVCLIMLISVDWLPTLTLSIERIKILFSFGWKILVSSLLDNVYREIHNLIVGKLYPASSLAFFNKGQEFPKFLVININSSIQEVMLPTYASLQSDLERLKKVVRLAIMLTSYVVFPLLIGLASSANHIVTVVLTDKWLSSIPFIRIYCLALIFHPVNMANSQAINAIGRSDIYLKVNIIKKGIAFVILAISIPFGIYSIAIGSIFSGIIFMVLNILPNKKLLNYGVFEQIKDIFPSLIISLLMGIIVYCINFLPYLGSKSSFLILPIQIMTGVIVYLGLSIIFKIESFDYLKSKLFSL